MIARHSPNPMRRTPLASHDARMITSSPSAMNLRCSPVGSDNGSPPRLVISRIDPSEPSSGPEIVPVPIKSPGRILHPLEV